MVGIVCREIARRLARSFRAWGALTCVVSATTACVEAPPPVVAGTDGVIDRLSCLGQTPACLSACAEGKVLSGASCEHGAWSCAAGVREDLCCDAVNAPESCPPWGDTCSAETPCASGYTCVESRAFPLPFSAESDASAEGLCRFGDWSLGDVASCDGRDALVWPEALLLGHARPIQVEGVVGVEPRCDDTKCTAENPCCQSCIGAYTLALTTSEGEPMSVALRTETTACGGTNCGYSCAPLQPGRRYRVWGLWEPDADAGAGTLYYAGHCDD